MSAFFLIIWIAYFIWTRSPENVITGAIAEPPNDE